MLNQQHPPRQGDVQAMLRLMQPLGGGSGAASGSTELSQRKRRLLADLCRLIGNEVNGKPDKIRNGDGSRNGNGDGHAHQSADPADAIDALLKAQRLSRRMEQTLRSLLGGDSEKQVAAKLGLSQHTVHVYVKQLYKRYGVSTRAELLAIWVQSQPS
jgi:DNA-binding CsgD family transcriptional regulator